MLAHLDDTEQVDIHSGSFALFLHHAFPLECAHPVSTSTPAKGDMRDSHTKVQSSASTSQHIASSLQLVAPDIPLELDTRSGSAEREADEARASSSSFSYLNWICLCLCVFVLVYMTHRLRPRWREKLKVARHDRALAESCDLKGMV